LTSFQLRDLLCSNFTLESIKAAIELKVAQSKAANNNNVMALHLIAKPELPKEETAAEKKKRIGYPQ